MKKSNKRGAPSRVIQNKAPEYLSRPGMWSPSIKKTATFRFQTTNNTAGLVINDTNLQDLKCMATGAAAAYRIFGGVKLNYVEMWANAQAGTPVTISAEWLSNNPYFGNDSNLKSDTALGTAENAHVKFRPPRGSYAAGWLSNNIGANNNILQLAFPIGTIIDVSLTFTILDDDVQMLVTGGLAGATIGKVYTRYLDSTGAKIIQPVSANII